MKLKSGFYQLLLLFFFPIIAFSQSDFLRHKNQYLSLSKQPQSIGRDTLMIIELDSLMLEINDANTNDIGELKELAILKELKRYSELTKWTKGKAIYDLWYAVHAHHLSGENIKSLEHFIMAESLFEKIKDYNHQALTLIRMGAFISYRYKEVKDELKYINKGIEVAKKANNEILIFKGLNAKAEYYYTKADYTRALELYKEISEIKNLETVSYIGNDLSIGVTYLHMDKPQEALKYLISTLKKTPQSTQYGRYLITGTYYELMDYFIKKENYIEAKKYLIKLKGFINIIKEVESAYPKYEYQIEKGLGNYLVALKAFERHQQIVLQDIKKVEKNNIDGIKSKISLQEQTAKLQKAELEKLRSENAKQSQLRWFWAILSIIGILTTFYVLYYNKRLRKINQSLTNKNAEISAALLQGQTIERKRVAADLHDNLGSTMSSLIWTMDAIDANKLQPGEKEVYQNLKSIVSKAYDEVRLLSHNLLPEEFEKQGLTAALQFFVRKVNQNSSIKFDLKIDETLGKLDKKVEFELYSICLELVNNIIKHSKATVAKIEISKTENLLKLSVEDNGIGIFENNSDGKGMKNVQMRIDSLRGVWNYEAIQPSGLINRFSIPLS